MTNLNGYAYLACRHYLHAWDDGSAHWVLYENVVGRKNKRRHVELVLETPCFRCPVVRIDSYNPRSHERISTKRDYPPEGYLTPGTGLKKQDFTAAYLTVGAKKAITIDWEDET